MNQLAERGIGVWEILAKEMQKPVGELQKMAEKGEILAKDVLPMILKSFDENYGGMMDKMSDTAQGRLDELIATFRELVSELGKMLAPIFKVVLDGLLTVLNFFQS